MANSPPSPMNMIIDSCCLIDYMKSDRAVIGMISEHVGPLHVASPIVTEIKDFRGDAPQNLTSLGLVIIEPELEDLFNARDMSGPTSFYDNICLLLAKRHGLTCVTNDKNLRKICRNRDIGLYWGLQLIVELHRRGGIESSHAADIGRRIHLNEPKYIPSEILEIFLKQLKG